VEDVAVSVGSADSVDLALCPDPHVSVDSPVSLDPVGSAGSVLFAHSVVSVGSVVSAGSVGSVGVASGEVVGVPVATSPESLRDGRGADALGAGVPAAVAPPGCAVVVDGTTVEVVAECLIRDVVVRSASAPASAGAETGLVNAAEDVDAVPAAPMSDRVRT